MELRRGDVLARSGGDEFIAVLDDCDSDRAQAVAARMIASIRDPVSACIGVVVVPGGDAVPTRDLPGLLRTVDAALYEGKSAGPGTVVVTTAPPTGGSPVPPLPAPRTP